MALRSGDKSMNAGAGDSQWKRFARTTVEPSRGSRFSPNTIVLPIFLLLLLLGLAVRIWQKAPAMASTDSSLKTTPEASVAGEKGDPRNAPAGSRKRELGSETVFLVLEAQTEVAQAESSVLQAEVAYEVAVAAVQHATGKLLKVYQVQIRDIAQ